MITAVKSIADGSAEAQDGCIIARLKMAPFKLWPRWLQNPKTVYTFKGFPTLSFSTLIGAVGIIPVWGPSQVFLHGNWVGRRVTPCHPNGTKIASFPSNILLTSPSLIHAHSLQGHNYKRWQWCRKPWSNVAGCDFPSLSIHRPRSCTQGSGVDALCCCIQSATILNSRRGVVWLITCFKFHSGTLIMC